ncbi:MAG: histidinol phosphate phosphatase domain-containing protein [Syntrophales bacterium]
MIDLHTHSIFSDGELIPSELVRRARVLGYRGIAITDHADHSNIDFVIPRVCKVCEKLMKPGSINVVPGIEITHVSPGLIPELAREAKFLGARIVVVHGETIAEPVEPGTNLAALESPIDILAHPGLISEQEVVLAARKSIYLEISARKGHSLTNGHVAALARRFKAPLVLNTDGHAPEDLIQVETARRIAMGAGMLDDEIERMFQNSEKLLSGALGK